MNTGWIGQDNERLSWAVGLPKCGLEERLSWAVGLPKRLTSAKSQIWGYLVLSCRFNFIKNFTN
jgi:hypothetical protein